MPGLIAHTDRLVHPDAHPYAHTDADAERVTDQGAHTDRIPNELIRPVYRAVDAWGDTVDNSDGERLAERDVIDACRHLLAYVDGEQQRDSDAERDEPRPEWVAELVANVRRAADAAERIAERVCYPQPEPEPEPDPDSEFDAIRRAYRLGWDAGDAAAQHRDRWPSDVGSHHRRAVLHRGDRAPCAEGRGAMTARVATVRGELTLKISGAEAVTLGWLEIPIEVVTQPEGIADLDAGGNLVLRATPNMREVRELIEQVFLSEGASKR